MWHAGVHSLNYTRPLSQKKRWRSLNESRMLEAKTLEREMDLTE